MDMPAKEGTLLYTGLIQIGRAWSSVSKVLPCNLDKGRKDRGRRGPTKLMSDTLQIVPACLGPKQGHHERELPENKEA